VTRQPYTIDTITAEDEVLHLQEDWNRLSLASDSPNVFMTFDWFQAWYQRLVRQEGSGRHRSNILVLRKNGTVTGISPLIQTISSRFGFSLRRLQFLAREHEWDYNDLVLGSDMEEQTEAIVNFLNHTSKEWDLIDLRDLRDTGGRIARIESTLTRAGLSYHLLPEQEKCPYMPIDGPWSEMSNRHSRSTRRVYHGLIEMTRKGLKVRIVEDPQKEPQLLERLIAIEAQKHVGGKPSPPFLGKYPEVFQLLFDTLGPRGWISVVLLEWKDRLVAWQLLYRCGKSLWGYLTAYDHHFSSLSPGTMLIPMVIDYGFTHGFDEFDFLNGEESYKMRWSTGYHQTYRLLIWNRRWFSRLCARAYFKLRVRPLASSLAERST
jgi:CelD/BcsL family acetyltransferase involved in cellulose biosynthesis